MAGCPHVCARMGAEALREGALVQSVTTKGYAVGLSMAAFLAIAGCTGDAKPAVTISTTSPASSTTSTSESTTGSGSSTTPNTTASTTEAADPNVPAAARAKTADGAVAFTDYFAKQANAAYQQLKPSLINTLSTSDCKTCAAMVKTVEGYNANNQRYNGEFMHLTLNTIGTFEDGPDAKTFIRSETAPVKVSDSRGSTVQTLPAVKGNFSIFLIYHAGSWRVSEIQGTA